MYLRVSSGGDKVEEGVNTVVTEAGVTLDTRLLCEDVIVLAFKVANDLLERELVVDVVTESRGIDNGERDANAIFLQF